MKDSVTTISSDGRWGDFLPLNDEEIKELEIISMEILLQEHPSKGATRIARMLATISSLKTELKELQWLKNQ